MKLLNLIPFFFLPLSVFAADEVNETYFGDLAIHGYDPVAYFTEMKPVKGNKAFEYQWEGAKWRFSSEENLEMFKKDPEKYAPQYGGYCAWAVSQGYTADIDPEAWTIYDGKLYLNYSKDIQKKWSSDKESLIKKGNEMWVKIKPKKE